MTKLYNKIDWIDAPTNRPMIGHRLSAFGIFYALIIVLVVLYFLSLEYSRVYVCTFDRIPQKFEATWRAINDHGELIVVNRDGKVYALPRRQIIQCQQAETTKE